MRKIILVVLMVLGLCVCAFAKEDKKTVKQPKIQVAIYVDHLQQELEYWGEIDAGCFEKIVQNKLVKGFFKLDNAHWLDKKNESLVSLKDTMLAGRKAPYTGSVYLRVEDVGCIVKLDKKQLEKAK